MSELDVRTIPPAARHPTIFGRLDVLAPGDTLTLVNDHDPVPLKYQIEATRPGEFRWDKVQDGPAEWRVDITSTARVFDARPVISGGGEPFDQIMGEVDQLEDGQVLVVIAPFEPVPLEGVLAERGFAHVAQDLGGGDWKVTFLRQS